MSVLAEKRKYTPEEYLALEDKAEFRSEYDDGEIVAMAGGSLNHARIVKNASRLLDEKLRNSCESFTTDVKVQIQSYRKFCYPDVLVICGSPTFFQNRKDTITNPVLIIEVLSDSTEAKDRGEKMLAYRTLESLREYVLISQTRPIVEKYTKDDTGNWIHTATIGPKSAVKFESVGIELNSTDIYRRIEFKEENL